MNRARPSATDLFTRNSVPDEEIDQVRRDVVAHPQYYDRQWVADAYAACGLDVAAGRWRTDTFRQVRERLADGEPFSVIRIGDDEVHFLAFGEYDGTPHLDRHVFQQAVNNQSDRFVLAESWMLVLPDSMYAAVADADVVGVLGIDRRRPASTKTWTRGLLGSIETCVAG